MTLPAPNWFVFVAAAAQVAAAVLAASRGDGLTVTLAWLSLGVANFFFAFLR